MKPWARSDGTPQLQGSGDAAWFSSWKQHRRRITDIKIKSRVHVAATAHINSQFVLLPHCDVWGTQTWLLRHFSSVGTFWDEINYEEIQVTVSDSILPSTLQRSIPTVWVILNLPEVTTADASCCFMNIYNLSRIYKTHLVLKGVLH